MCAWKPHIGAAVSEVHGFFGRENFQAPSSERRAEAMAVCWGRCSTAPIRRGALASPSIMRWAAVSKRLGSRELRLSDGRPPQRIASLQLEIAETLRQAVRQVQSTAERIQAARAGAGVARQRLDVEQRRYEVGLSTSFLVTQAQRDLLQTEVNLLQATLDHQSALVSFEALQQAPALSDGRSDRIRGFERHPLGPSAPTGLFRPGSATGF